ncbi:hypothetical protein DB347_01210 [Opitutaceae bacterium EW11]|nr:hypothetical protein DB347_01210 [Opitutaceae bacterium EW11]
MSRTRGTGHAGQLIDGDDNLGDPGAVLQPLKDPLCAGSFATERSLELRGSTIRALGRPIAAERSLFCIRT